MDKGVKEKLDIIDNILKRYEETIYATSSPQDLDYFCKWFLENCEGLSLDDEYIEIIALIDCFDFNGLSFYSINNDNENNIYESNDIYWENENLKKYLFIGEDSISWYAIAIDSGKYYMLDKPSSSSMREFNAFKELLLVALESVL